MAGSRFNAIAKANWAWLGPAFKGLSDDLEAVEAGGGGSGGAVTTANLQAGLGLSSGSTTSATKSLFTGTTGATWADRGGQTRAIVRALNPAGLSSDPYPTLLAGHSADPLGDFPIELLQPIARSWTPT